MADAVGISREMWAKYEAGAEPGANALSLASAAGVDVVYILTGQRQGAGLGESAVHQAVLDAVDLLSLGKKVDGQQLAAAVLKLISRSAPPTSPMNQQSVMGGSAQQFNAPIHGGVAMGKIIHKTKRKPE